jgi:ubiquitin C-terminal hydrolase
MELLRFLLDGLHEDLNRVSVKPKYQELPGEGDPNKIAAEWWNYNLSRDSSVITDYFSGQLISTITCGSCRHKTYSADTFLDLPLPIPDSRSYKASVSLTSCFDMFGEEEEIEDYHCSSCKKKRRCYKQMQIYRFPKILVIQLKRFSQSGWRR